MLRLIGGCGCLLGVMIAMIFAFWLGMEYGPGLKQKFNTKSTEVIKETQNGIRQIDTRIKKAQETVDIFYPKPDAGEKKQD